MTRKEEKARARNIRKWRKVFGQFHTRRYAAMVFATSDDVKVGRKRRREVEA